MSIRVKLHPDYGKEKAYVFHCLFERFLGLSYSLEWDSSSKDYQIILKNGKQFLLEDHFFYKYVGVSYLSKEALPDRIERINLPVFTVSDLPLLYGNADHVASENKIEAKWDLVASIFFMLTRWEEYVVTERDNHQRFSAKSSLAYKEGFLHRPIVNECVELVWNVLKHLGTTQERKSRIFQIIPTHDVDLPKMWWNVKDFFRTFGGSLIKKRDWQSVLWHPKAYWKKLTVGIDPFDTFDLLMDLSEHNNMQSHFFFMSGGLTNKDNYYKIDHPWIKQLIERIDARGHGIGFHPSYNAYMDRAQFKKEKDLLQAQSPQEIKTGREHFLRFEVPTTWQIWEENGMEWDSTMSYADHEGFRCGVCYPFPVFDILGRKQLKLIERPLIIMDGSLVTYQSISVEEAFQKVNGLVQTVKKYQGEFVFLWHNSAFGTPMWRPFESIYTKTINENSNNRRRSAAVY